MKKKFHIARCFCLFLSFLFVLKIYSIMASPQEKYRSASTDSRMLLLYADRGAICDRNGIALVGRETEYYYLLKPENLSATQDAFPFSDEEYRLATLYRIPKIKKSKMLYPVSEAIETYAHPIRYADFQAASQLIGYTDESGHGVCGLEKVFDPILFEGGASVDCSYLQTAIGGVRLGSRLSVRQQPIKSGLTLTLEYGLQTFCERRLLERNMTGCALVSDCKSGEILALASSPAYSPTDLPSALANQNSPLIERAFQAYDAGSIFKIITAAAALEAGYTDTLEGTCTGYFDADGRHIACSKRTGHGKETLREAFRESCNPYFCELAVKLGGKSILSLAEKCGFGQYTQLYPGLTTASGHLPAQKDLCEEAFLALFGFGQGNLQVTPLQMLQLMNILADDGIKKPLSLFSEIRGAEGELTPTEKTASVRVFSEQTAKTLRSMMADVVEKGSGTQAKSDFFSACGKTGTAETGWRVDGENMVHGWFVGFFPADEPKYAVVIFAENGKSGALTAAPLFKEIAEYLWFNEGFLSPAVFKP